MADQVPLRIVYVSGVPTIGEFQSGDTIASSIAAGGGAGGSIYISGMEDVELVDLQEKQHLMWDGTDWINVWNDTTEILVRNGTGSTIFKGEAVHVTGSHSADQFNVELADASDSSKMPAIGILDQDLAPGATGIAITFGLAQGLVTSGLTEGATAYVSPTTPGAITDVKPTDAAHLIQNIGIVVKAHATNGFLKVTGVGRANDVDNVTRLNLSSVYETVFDFSSTWTGGTGITDHGLLTGLSDNDHPQYLLSSTYSAASGNWEGAYNTVLDNSGSWEESADITYVSGVVAQNIIDIGTNATDIGNNTSLIGTNQSNIAANDNDITYLSGVIDTNTTNITGNDNDITYVSGVVDTNASNHSSHTGDATIHFTEASIDHGSIAGLGDNDHPQYLLSSTYSAASGNWEGTYDTVTDNSGSWTAGIDLGADYDFSSTEFHVFSGNVNVNWSGTNGPTGTNRRGKLNVRNDSAAEPTVSLYSDNDTADAAPILEFNRESASPASADYLGQLKWIGKSDTGSSRIYAKVTGKIDEATNGDEGGLIEFMTRQGGSELIMARFKDNTFRTVNGVEIWSDGDVEINTSSVSGTMADVKTLEDKIQYVNTKTHLPQINSSYSGLTAWTEGTGSMTDWDIHPSMEASSNVREFAPDPFNGSSIVWKAFDDGPHDTQSWEGGFFPTGSAQALDTSKPHRFSVFIKQHGNKDGSLYIGPHTTGSSAWAVVNQVTGVHNSNPYFEAGDNPEVDEWYLWVGFINASGTTTGSKNYDDLAGMYAMDGTRTNAGFDEYTFSSTATNQSLRAFYYSDSANDAQIGASFWAPRIDALDGNEPNIEDLLGLINTNHTEYARIDGTKNLQTQPFSDTYTGTVGDTSLGFGIETTGNLVNKAGNYLMFSSTNGYQFRKDGLTAYTSTDLPDAMRRWDDGYENTYRSLIQLKEAGGGQNINGVSKSYVNFDTTDVSIGDAATDFTFNGTDTITINTTAVYEVTFNLAVSAGGTGTSNQRTAQLVRLEKNGTDEGPAAATGYIRVTSNHLDASYHLTGHVMSLTATDTLKIGSTRASASAGTVTTTANQCFWTIRRIG